jgi:hypothetical protein
MDETRAFLIVALFDLVDIAILTENLGVHGAPPLSMRST